MSSSDRAGRRRGLRKLSPAEAAGRGGGDDDDTGLFSACADGDLELAASLLHGGLNPNCLDKEGNTPLHHAVWNGHQGTAMLLVLEHMAETHFNNNDNLSPVDLALRRGWSDMIPILMPLEASINHRDACEQAAAEGVSLPLILAMDIDLESELPPPSRNPPTGSTRQMLEAALQRLDYFGDLIVRQLKQGLDSFSLREVEAGTELVAKGDDPSNFYVVASGKFSVFDSSRAFPSATITNPGSFGFMPLLYHCKEPCTVKAEVDSAVWVLPGLVFQTLVFYAACCCGIVPTGKFFPRSLRRQARLAPVLSRPSISGLDLADEMLDRPTSLSPAISGSDLEKQHGSFKHLTSSTVAAAAAADLAKTQPNTRRPRASSSPPRIKVVMQGSGSTLSN